VLCLLCRLFCCVGCVSSRKKGWLGLKYRGETRVGLTAYWRQRWNNHLQDILEFVG
jgi:hypothetical protein